MSNKNGRRTVTPFIYPFSQFTEMQSRKNVLGSFGENTKIKKKEKARMLMNTICFLHVGGNGTNDGSMIMQRSSLLQTV